MNKPHRHIQIIDQTIREGMQFRGMMLSLEERKKIVDFQESLGVDISQVAYPPAHESEKKILGELKDYVSKKGYQIRVAGLGRALKQDVDEISSTGVGDIHLTVIPNIHKGLELKDNDPVFLSLKEAVDHARLNRANPCIGVSILDIGKISMHLIKRFIEILVNDLKVDIFTLPDTSGIMPPNFFYDRVREVVKNIKKSNTCISVHCHNDMGMATANTIMGVIAGAQVVETTALGIGERNGIGDIFLVSKTLKDQGFEMNLKVKNIEGVEAYYAYVNQLCLEKINTPLLNYQTPFFGESMKVHVAGTHGRRLFGAKADGQNWYLNVLCGRHLVSQYLEAYGIDYEKKKLSQIVKKIKDKSVESGRSLLKEEVVAVVAGV